MFGLQNIFLQEWVRRSTAVYNELFPTVAKMPGAMKLGHICFLPKNYFAANIIKVHWSHTVRQSIV